MWKVGARGRILVVKRSIRKGFYSPLPLLPHSHLHMAVHAQPVSLTIRPTQIRTYVQVYYTACMRDNIYIYIYIYMLLASVKIKDNKGGRLQVVDMQELNDIYISKRQLLNRKKSQVIKRKFVNRKLLQMSIRE